MTSSARSPFHSPRPLSYRLPIVTYLLALLVSEIFDLKVADKQTDRQAGRRLVRSLLTLCVFVVDVMDYIPEIEMRTTARILKEREYVIHSFHTFINVYS